MKMQFKENLPAGRQGVALVTVLAFVLVLTILAGVLLGLMTNQIRISEHQIRRIKAYYAAWAGLVHNFERLRKNQPIENQTIDGYTFNITYNSTSHQINSTVNYTR